MMGQRGRYLEIKWADRPDVVRQMMAKRNEVELIDRRIHLSVAN